ncbi:Ig-like domain-containing protein [Pontibacter lucknowensis]|uniref:Por secretion system C-terminal sorting domain-containing protein n=1 Tax=Pontibacter lucknowensis TaxID=1077936 RepID=A0A1N6USL2_9BACT|nr:T9SS type A sorting domain-containing protein [Pontibacter lucknowensis]SIQ68630.1 Por secretion system C-terminal sorting domain-containing protein [Pontibacter lucknowensis]
MKHIYNPTAAFTQRPTANATGTAAASKVFMLLLLSFFLLASGESVGQSIPVYNNGFTASERAGISFDSDGKGIGPSYSNNELVINSTGTGSSAGYNGFIFINTNYQTKPGFTYNISLKARVTGSGSNRDGKFYVNLGNSESQIREGAFKAIPQIDISNTDFLSTTSANLVLGSMSNLVIGIYVDGSRNDATIRFDDLVITERCAPPVPQAFSASSCTGPADLVLTATGATAGERYRWYKGNSSSYDETIEGSYSVRVSTSTIYYVSRYNVLGQCEGPRVAIEALIGKPVKPTVTTTDNCPTGEVVLTARGASAGDTYVWMRNGNIVAEITATSANNFTSTQTFKRANEYGLVSVYIRKPSGSLCTQSDSWDVNVMQQGQNITSPSASAISACIGGSVVLTASGAVLGETYRWYTNQADVFPQWQGDIYEIEAPTTQTTYYVSKYNITLGCESAKVPISVTPAPILQHSAITGNQTVCQGRTEIYSVPNVVGASYTWSIVPADGFVNSPAPSIANANTNQVSITSPNEAYRGTLRVTVSNSCNSYTSELTVEASNNNVATGNLVEPVNPVVGQPETYGFASNIDDNLIGTLIWSYRRTNSPEWISTSPSPTTSRTFTFQSMPGDLNGVRVEIQVLNPENYCVTGLSATNTFFVGNEAIVPLPVELMFFKAQAQTKGVNLTWATASEQENKGFEVQVSRNARDFEAIGFVESKVGTTALRQDYNFLDTKAVIGTRYYRLKQVDLDGTTSYSPIRAVALNTGNGTASAYPNPFDDAVVVTLNGTEARNVQVMLMDAMGKVLQQRTEETSGNSITVDMRSVTTKGMYVLYILDNDTKHTFKLMKR